MTRQPGDATPPERTCFVIGPIGPEKSERRQHADQLLHHIIEPAAAANGLSALRADGINSSGIISSEIVTLLRDAAIVVADLSFGNGNAFYELAIRHLLRRPFVHVIREGDEIPFDAFANRAVRFDLANLDSAERAREQLQGVIETEKDKTPEQVETPFSTALDLLALESTSAGDGGIADLANAVVRLEANLGARLATIDFKLESVRTRPGLVGSPAVLGPPPSVQIDAFMEAFNRRVAADVETPEAEPPGYPSAMAACAAASSAIGTRYGEQET